MVAKTDGMKWNKITVNEGFGETAFAKSECKQFDYVIEFTFRCRVRFITVALAFDDIREKNRKVVGGKINISVFLKGFLKIKKFKRLLRRVKLSIDKTRSRNKHVFY